MNASEIEDLFLMKIYEKGLSGKFATGRMSAHFFSKGFKELRHCFVVQTK
jgi:hypothetical protein